ncbi:hypothetical protein [Aurantiacibacter sp. D1-12]|uniref:hypothetical protein n=1 Tax=Aurantiacibacter sp. D1-12 TaxID=2993658 RepID=UPI00237CB5BC|nr:hypothetical protein [Aurantiacibacter sp. D1-12]MDE1467631.1 hypothetical protein [Aurantiacibacter sp. D1-12]
MTDVKTIKSDANSWTIEIWDSEGISHIDVVYGTWPRLHRHRERHRDCIPGLTLTVPRTRKFFFRSEPFHQIEIGDCSLNEKGRFIITRGWVDKDDKIIGGSPYEMDQATQDLLDAVQRHITISMWQEILQRGILIILILLLLIAFAILLPFVFGSALGPLWGG